MQSLIKNIDLRIKDSKHEFDELCKYSNCILNQINAYKSNIEYLTFIKQELSKRSITKSAADGARESLADYLRDEISNTPEDSPPAGTSIADSTKMIDDAKRILEEDSFIEQMSDQDRLLKHMAERRKKRARPNNVVLDAGFKPFDFQNVSNNGVNTPVLDTKEEKIPMVTPLSKLRIRERKNLTKRIFLEAQEFIKIKMPLMDTESDEFFELVQTEADIRLQAVVSELA
jgi:hypothetical protein